ncbi:hypothetical protein AB5J72_01500 [Streptomyces sp. CG1]
MGVVPVTGDSWEGYVHVIGDMRGTGDSDSVMAGNYNFGGQGGAR